MFPSKFFYARGRQPSLAGMIHPMVRVDGKADPRTWPQLAFVPVAAWGERLQLKPPATKRCWSWIYRVLYSFTKTGRSMVMVIFPDFLSSEFAAYILTKSDVSLLAINIIIKVLWSSHLFVTTNRHNCKGSYKWENTDIFIYLISMPPSPKKTQDSLQ